jgi:hypothetical protein
MARGVEAGSELTEEVTGDKGASKEGQWWLGE